MVISKNILIVLIAVIIYSSHFLQICCAGESQGPLPKEDMDRMKKIYEFDKWAGKVKVPNKRVDKLEIDPNYFKTLSKEIKIDTAMTEKERRLVFNIVDKDTDLSVDIDIAVVKDELTAHTNILNFLSLCTALPPVCKRIDPNDPNNPLNIGDACFVFGHKVNQKNNKGVISILMFCRNNVNVMLRNSDDDTKTEYPDLGEIARFIDKKLIEISKTKEDKK
jgi:hypothetical protein